MIIEETTHRVPVRTADTEQANEGKRRKSALVRRESKLGNGETDSRPRTSEPLREVSRKITSDESHVVAPLSEDES